MKNKGLLTTIFSIVIISLLAVTIIFIFGNNKKESTDKGNTEDIVESKVLTDFDEYKDLNTRTDIVKVTIKRYTVGGRNDEEYNTYEDIRRLQNNITSIKIGKETDRACEDNTTVYTFETSKGLEINVEIECDWLIIGNKRYLIEK